MARAADGLGSTLQEHDGVGQDPVLVRELVEGADKRPDEGSIRGERLGRDEHEAGVGPARRLVAVIQGREVFYVGRYEGPALRGCSGKDLLVRQGHPRRIFENRHHIVAPGPELLGDGVAQHLVEQKGAPHRLSREKAALMSPCELGGSLGVVSETRSRRRSLWDGYVRPGLAANIGIFFAGDWKDAAPNREPINPHILRRQTRSYIIILA